MIITEFQTNAHILSEFFSISWFFGKFSHNNHGTGEVVYQAESEVIEIITGMEYRGVIGVIFYRATSRDLYLIILAFLQAPDNSRFIIIK